MLSFLYGQLSHPYMTTGKTIALTRWTFVGKVMSLPFNMLPHKAKPKDLLPRPKPTVSFQSFSNKMFFSITTVRHILIGNLLLLQLDSPINGSFSVSFTGSQSSVRIVFPDPFWIFSTSLLLPRSVVHPLCLFPIVCRCNDTHISLLNPDLFTFQPVYPNVIGWNTGTSEAPCFPLDCCQACSSSCISFESLPLVQVRKHGVVIYLVIEQMFPECLLYARHYGGHLGHNGEWDLSFSLHHISISHQVPSRSLMSVKVTQSCLTLWDPMHCIVHGILQARILEWVAFPISRGVFPTQGSNPGLPHCRWILYQLSHKGSPHSLDFS